MEFSLLYQGNEMLSSACKTPCHNLSPQLARCMAPLCPALLKVRAIRVNCTARMRCSRSFGKPARLYIPAHRLATEVQLPGDPNNTPALLVQGDNLFIACDPSEPRAGSQCGLRACSLLAYMSRSPFSRGGLCLRQMLPETVEHALQGFA